MLYVDNNGGVLIEDIVAGETRFFFGPVIKSNSGLSLVPYLNGKIHTGTDAYNKANAVDPAAVCPSGRRAFGTSYENDNKNWVVDGSSLAPNASYAYNYCCVDKAAGERYRRFTQIPRPATRFLMGDVSIVDSGGTVGSTAGRIVIYGHQNIARRHSNKGNISFADLHVESWTGARLSSVSTYNSTSNVTGDFWHNCRNKTW